MKGWNLAQMAHLVNVIPPIDITGGVNGDRFSMAKYQHASIIIQAGVSAAAWTKIILRECNQASGGSATDIPFTLYACETAAGDVLGAKEDVAATGKTPSANNNIMYLIELDAAELTEDYHWVEVALTNGVNSVIASAVAILSGSRYSSDQSATVLS